MNPLPAAVLWDMDGTLVDTEPDWIATEHELVRSYGGNWTEEDSVNLVGSSLMDAGEYIRTRGELPLTAAEVVDVMVERMIERLKESLTWRPGARELLDDLRVSGVPCALVTNSFRRLTDVVVCALPPETFALTVTGDEVTRGKPHPEPYLRAARGLGVAADQCIVIEDSKNGARSGLAAGARVVMVPNMVAAEVAGAVTVASLSGLRASDLVALVGSGGRST
jgi:HAD superfamily hydrolase (TIGR01509 family)